MKLAFQFIFSTFLLRMDSVYELESFVRGPHVYGRIWSATVDEQLECKPERGNKKDPYAFAGKKSAITSFVFLEVLVRSHNLTQNSIRK